MAMVMPRSRSSGALSMVSNERYSPPPLRLRYLVMAAVRLVLPWSIWPIVPMLTCGLVRSNFFLAMMLLLFLFLCGGWSSLHAARAGRISFFGECHWSWSPHWDLNPRPLPYQGSALPAELCGPGHVPDRY